MGKFSMADFFTHFFAILCFPESLSKYAYGRVYNMCTVYILYNILYI